MKWSFGNLEVAQPVDHVEHCEAEGEEGAGNFVDSEKNMCTYLGWITRLQDYKIVNSEKNMFRMDHKGYY